MPTPHAQGKAAELQRQLTTLTGHQHARVKPYGKHLLIQIHRIGSDGDDDEVNTIARLTELGRTSYSSAFRSHTGRWEPLPGTGDRYRRRVGHHTVGPIFRAEYVKTFKGCRTRLVRSGGRRRTPTRAHRGGRAQATRSARVQVGQHGARQSEDHSDGGVPLAEIPQVRRRLLGRLRLPIRPSLQSA